MAEGDPKKEFRDLDLWVWRTEYDPRGNILINGMEPALRALARGLGEMLQSVALYGRGTRRFRCNPPEESDLAREDPTVQGVRFHWFDWLVVKVEEGVSDGAAVPSRGTTLWSDAVPRTSRSLSKPWNSTSPRSPLKASPEGGPPLHGHEALPGLWFSPDWLGIE
jgi:hypothetical protein